MAFTYTDTAAQKALVERVEHRISMVQVDGATIASNRSYTYDELVEAMREVLGKADETLAMEAAADGSAATVTHEVNATLVQLPAGSLRILAIKLSNWDGRLVRLIYEDDPRYDLQRNAYTRADGSNPLAFLISDTTSPSKKAVACYPGGTGASSPTLALLNHIVETAPELVPVILQDAMIWNAASRVLTANRDTGADVAAARAQAAMTRRQYGMEGETRIAPRHRDG